MKVNKSDEMLALYEAGMPSSELALRYGCAVFEVHRYLYAARKRREKAAGEVVG